MSKLLNNVFERERSDFDRQAKRFGLLALLAVLFSGTISISVLVFIGWVVVRLLNHFGVN